MASYDKILFKQLDGYKNFLCAGLNGVVRLTNETPSNFEGLSTFGLKTCLGVVLWNQSSGKMSLAHILSMRTNPTKCVQVELEWMGDDPSQIKAVIAQNQAFLCSNPNHLLNVSLVMDLVKGALVNGGILLSNISIINASNGSVIIRRNTCAVTIPREEIAEMQLVGTPSPYYFLRDAIHNLPHNDGTVNADVQYDGIYWTKFCDVDVTVHGSMFTEDYLKNNYECFRNDLSKGVDKLRTEPLMLALRLNPKLYLNEYEWERGLSHANMNIMNYLIAKKEFDMSIITYKLFSLDRDQIATINTIGGKLSKDKDRGMYVISAPSRLLTAHVRKILKIERMRIKEPPQDSNVRERLCAIKGWRGEGDFEKPKHMLITFPYHDETYRVRMVEIMKSIVG